VSMTGNNAKSEVLRGLERRRRWAAPGALIIGLAEQLGSIYMPTYAVVLTFLIMALVLAVRPQGLLASR